MEREEYINTIVSIRNQINELINILWDCKENKEVFTLTGLENRVYSDIRYGYEFEEE